MAYTAMTDRRRKFNSTEPPAGLVEILADMIRSALAWESSPPGQENSSSKDKIGSPTVYPVCDHSLNKDEIGDGHKTGEQ